jgi:hypothetical protein
LYLTIASTSEFVTNSASAGNELEHSQLAINRHITR